MADRLKFTITEHGQKFGVSAGENGDLRVDQMPELPGDGTLDPKDSEGRDLPIMIKPGNPAVGPTDKRYWEGATVTVYDVERTGYSDRENN